MAEASDHSDTESTPDDRSAAAARGRRDGGGLHLGPIGTRTMVERYVIRPWPERRTSRVRWMLVVLVVLAPLVGIAISWLGVVSGSTEDLVQPVGAPADEHLFVDARAQSIDLARNEMTFRLVFRPEGTLNDGGVLAEDVTLVVNDVVGSSIRNYDTGTPMEPTTVTVALDGAQLVRYPFDAYQAQLVLGAVTVEPDGTTDALALDLALDVALDDFSATATTERSENSVTVQLELGRRASVVLWVVFFMVLVWAIALGCAAVSWFLLVNAKEPPYWVFPFMAAILFALPTLRAGLPGRPPYGSLVDWAAFYWAIAIVSIGLVGLLTLWNIEARARLREHDRHDGHDRHDRHDR